MNGGRCGRCRGRGTIRELAGLGINECPTCGGTGIKPPNGSKARRVSVPLAGGAWCIVCQDAPAVQNHHLVKQARIDRLAGALAHDAKADARGVVPTCLRNGCHGGLEDETIQLRDDQLPKGFWDYVSFYRLAPGLPRYLMERAA